MGPDQRNLEHAVPGSLPVALLSFSRQQRNLLLLRPLLTLEINKAFFANEEGERGLLNGLDTHYLGLALLDYLIESVPYYRGRTRDEVIAYLAGLIQVMTNELTREAAELAAAQILGAIENKRGGYQQFEFTYFDGSSAANLTYRYRLLKLEPDQYDDPRYSPTSEGYLVYLGMLDLRPEEYELVMQKASKLMLERNRYAEALELIGKARKSSIHYSQIISERLAAAMRSPRSVNWTNDFEPALDGARSHVGERQREDQLMLSSVQESLTNDSTREEARENLAKIREVLESASTLRTQLVTDIGQAPDRFLSAHAASLRARTGTHLPDLDTTFLPEIGKLPASRLAEIAERGLPLLYAPRIHRVFDLSTVITLLLQRRPMPEEIPEEEDRFENLSFPPSQFSDELIQSARDWLVKTLAGGEHIPVREILNRAEADGFDETGQRCITYWLFRTFHPETDVFGMDVGVEGRFSASFAEGAGLTFTDRTTKGKGETK